MDRRNLILGALASVFGACLNRKRQVTLSVENGTGFLVDPKPRLDDDDPVMRAWIESAIGRPVVFNDRDYGVVVFETEVSRETSGLTETVVWW